MRNYFFPLDGIAGVVFLMRPVNICSGGGFAALGFLGDCTAVAALVGTSSSLLSSSSSRERLDFAPMRRALAFSLLLCCCDAMPCPNTPGGPTRQRTSPLLMLTLCSCHCPQTLVGRYPRSSGPSVMLCAAPSSPGTHGIEQGKNHLLVRDAL